MMEMNQWVLLSRAIDAVGDCAPQVAADAKLAHIGFRSTSLDQWSAYREALRGFGTEHVTLKADGRQIVFIRLAVPHGVGGQTLRYLELPQPRALHENEPMTIAVFKHPTARSEAWKDGYDIRETEFGAEDFIKRDEGRA
jgi:hypothetical protein